VRGNELEAVDRPFRSHLVEDPQVLDVKAGLAADVHYRPVPATRREREKIGFGPVFRCFSAFEPSPVLLG
jgi:hypothetical protein